MHHRFLHPRLGHFLTPDFRAPDIFDPSTFTEPYAYAGGNPLFFIDLDGLAKRVFREKREDETEDQYVAALVEFLSTTEFLSPTHGGRVYEDFDFNRQTMLFGEITTTHELMYQIRILKNVLEHHKGKHFLRPASDSLEDIARHHGSLTQEQRQYSDYRVLLTKLQNMQDRFKQFSEVDSAGDVITQLIWGSHLVSIELSGRDAYITSLRGVRHRNQCYVSVNEKAVAAAAVPGQTQAHVNKAISEGPVKASSGPGYGSNPKANLGGQPPEKELRRPFKRKEFREKVQDAAPRTSDGRPVDPNTGLPIDVKPHYGHKYGKEHRRLLIEANLRNMTQKEFNDWINQHPEWFQLEDPVSNMSHKYEKP